MNMKSFVISRNNQGIHFTMIELMMVLGIILILAAMLLPTLSRSKDSAKSVFCVNNLKNLGLASFQYSQDWEVFVAWGSDDFTRWHGKRKTVSNSATYSPEGGPLFGYLKGQDISCPILSNTVDVDHASPERGGWGYGYNKYIGSLAYFVSDPNSEEALKTGIETKKLEHPDNTVMFTDTAALVSSSGALSSSASDPLAEYATCNAPKKMNNTLNDPSIHFRHARQCNITWGDGHVGSEMMTWSDTPWIDKQLGFWGDVDNSLFDPL